GALQAEVRRIIERADALPSRSDPKPIGKWSFGCDSDTPCGWITALGIQTIVKPAFVAVLPWEGDGRAEPNWPDSWLITDYGKEILDADAYEIRPDQKFALQWHKWLLQALFESWETGFVNAVRLGAAHIMARKHTVLAPFERVTWNQWQFFELDRNAS